MAKARNQSSKELFNAVKKLLAAGLTTAEISESLNIGRARISCFNKFDSFEEYEKGRSEVYKSWGKGTGGKKKHKEEKTMEEEQAPSLFPEDPDEKIDKLVRKQLEILQRNEELVKGEVEKIRNMMEKLERQQAEMETQRKKLFECTTIAKDAIEMIRRMLIR